MNWPVRRRNPTIRLDDTYKILSRRVNVSQTRGTSLIDITVKNPDADLAALIANRIADTYKEYRLDSWKNTHSLGLQALEQELTNNRGQLAIKMAQLDNLRTNLNIPELDSGSMGADTIYAETIRALEIRRIEAELDYNDHSSTLAKLKKLATNNLLEASLATVLRGMQDQEFIMMDRRR